MGRPLTDAELETWTPEGDFEPEPTATAVLVRTSDVEAEEVEWLWPGRVAVGKLTLVCGDPGLGKSFLSIDIVSRISRAYSWPDDCHSMAPLGSAIFLSAEDDIGDTIRPRLDASAADPSRVFVVTGIRNRNEDGEYERFFDLTRDVLYLEDAIEKTGDCRLVVIDPISAYLGATDSHRNAEVRGVLGPLADLAARKRVAVLAVTHLRKGDGPAMYRSMGSLAFVAAARAAWAVVADKEDKSRRLLLPIKNNLAPDHTGLAYSIQDRGHGPALEWKPGKVEVSVDDALSMLKDNGEQSAVDEAAEWLQDFLFDGPRLPKEIKAAARSDGIAERTLMRAKANIGVVSEKDGFQGKWKWRLPSKKGCQRMPSVTENKNVASFGVVGNLCEKSEKNDVFENT